MTHERRNLKLALTWVGKDNRRPLLEPRILLEESDNSHNAAARVTENDHFDNGVFLFAPLAGSSFHSLFSGDSQRVHPLKSKPLYQNKIDAAL